MAPTPAAPLILCYDGSEDARRAIERAGSLLSGGHAFGLDGVAAQRRPGQLAWSGATASMVNFFELDRAAAEDGGRVAERASTSHGRRA